MSDHEHLHAAFGEYERRADAIGAARASAVPPARTSRRNPVMLVAASVVLVLAVAGTVVWLAAGSGSPRRSGTPVGSVPSRTSTATPSPSALLTAGTATPSPSLTEPTSAPRSSQILVPLRPHPSGPSASGTGVPVTTAPSGGSSVPANAGQMKRALRRVLGGTATVRVDQHDGNYLTGILTATSTGAQGGFDIQALAGRPGDTANCEDPGPGSHCTVGTPAGGGSLARERESYQNGGGQLYYAEYVFPDGATYLMHLSNRADPKGAGRTFGRTPPLTLAQVVGIVGSDRWSTR